MAAQQDIAAASQLAYLNQSYALAPAIADRPDIWSIPSPQKSRPDVALSLPKRASPEPKIRIVRVHFDAPALPPLAHTVFCLKYPADCQTEKIVFRPGPLKLTAQRWSELERVNAEVNRSIIPQPNTHGLAAEKWLIAPKAGECHDYAVTKRHELIALGWPAHDLLLSEVIVPSGEHHLVLLIRTTDGDFVADNLTPDIRSWYKTPYDWVRVQSASNPMIWSKVSGKSVWVARSSLSRHAQS
jgi:predicted transglutaminase-like cysteine proteinase